MTVRPPTLREKKRYVLAKILPEGTSPDPKDLYYAVLESVASLWGDHGASLVHPAVIAVEPGHAVVRCRRGAERELALALSAVTACAGQPVALRAVATSGTIESLRERIRTAAPGGAPPQAGQEECVFHGRACTIVSCDGQKVDVIEKGFKNTTRFYLTTEDLEDPYAATIPDGI